MKFMFFFYPAIHATPDEREQPRPITAHGRTPAMKALTGTGWPGRANDFGFTDAFRLPEHAVPASARVSSGG